MSRPFVVHTVESLRARCVEEGECWIWQGASDGHGKPSTKHNGRTANPRRVVRELVDRKPLPPGVQVVPACHNSMCISPACCVKTDHRGRARIANERGAFSNPAKNRLGAMTKRAKSWITDEMVALIRAARNGPEAAHETGVSLSHCKAIRRGIARKDYSSPWASMPAANDANRRRAA